MLARAGPGTPGRMAEPPTHSASRAATTLVVVLLLVLIWLVSACPAAAATGPEAGLQREPAGDVPPASPVDDLRTIPEPLAFDLVRGLGAARGELEVNTLGVVSLRRPGIHWAPEVEYAFLDGHAFELELPFANQRFGGVKL